MAALDLSSPGIPRLLALLLLCCSTAVAFEREDWEEDLGSVYRYTLGTADDVYGLGIAMDTRLTGTPIVGELFVDVYWLGREDALYSGIGMSFRLMPALDIAPFVGGGGSLNEVLARGADRSIVLDDGTVADDRGDSFWASHAEGGVRVALDPYRRVELSFRQTWPDLQGDREFWQITLACNIEL